MRYGLIFLILAISAGPVFSQSEGTSELEIISWSREKLAQHEQFKRVGPAAEWRKKIAEGDHEWLAVSLAVSYSIEKRVNLGLKGDRPNTPVLDENISRLRARLVSLGRYVAEINR